MLQESIIATISVDTVGCGDGAVEFAVGVGEPGWALVIEISESSSSQNCFRILGYRSDARWKARSNFRLLAD